MAASTLSTRAISSARICAARHHGVQNIEGWESTTFLCGDVLYLDQFQEPKASTATYFNRHLPGKVTILLGLMAQKLSTSSL